MTVDSESVNSVLLIQRSSCLLYMVRDNRLYQYVNIFLWIMELNQQFQVL